MDTMSAADLDASTDARHAARLRRIAGVLKIMQSNARRVMTGIESQALADAAELLEGYAAEPLHRHATKAAPTEMLLCQLADRIKNNPLGWLPGVGDCVNVTFTTEEAALVVSALATERGQS
jgi:hypothetical protein